MVAVVEAGAAGVFVGDPPGDAAAAADVVGEAAAGADVVGDAAVVALDEDVLEPHAVTIAATARMAAAVSGRRERTIICKSLLRLSDRMTNSCYKR